MMKYVKLFIVLITVVSIIGCASTTTTMTTPRYPMADVIDSGDINAINALLDKGTDVNAWDEHGTPLMEASSKGNAEMVKLLIDRGADANLIDHLGRSALGYAACAGHADIVKILIDKGADAGKTIRGLEKQSSILADYPADVTKRKQCINLIIKDAGWDYYDDGQYQNAINIFKRAINLNPSISSNFIGLSQSYVGLKQYDKAIAAIKRAIELQPQDSGPYNTLGYAYGKKKQYSKAFEAFRKSIQLNPKNYGAYGNYGKLLVEKGDYAGAAEAYKKAVKLHPSLNYLLRLADACRFAGKYNDAMTFVNRAIELQTHTGIGVYLVIESSYPVVKKVMETGPAQKADVRVGDKITEVDKKSAKGWSLKQVVQNMGGASGTPVTLMIKRKGVSKSIEKILIRETFLDDKTTAATSYALRSLIYRYKGNKEKSFMDAKKADSLDSSSGWVHIALCTISVDNGKYAEAIKYFSGVKDSTTVKILGATAYAKQGDFRKAINIYSAIPEEKLSSKNVPLWSDRAALLKALKPFIASTMKNIDSLKAQGHYKEALNELGNVLKIADEAKSKEILSQMSNIIQIAPGLSKLPEEARKYALRGNILLDQGKFEDAAKEYKKAVQAAPYIAKLYYDTAIIYGKLKRYAQAVRYMKIYLQLAPEAPNARAVKDQIYKWEFIMEEGNKEG